MVWDFLDATLLQTIDIAQPIHYICAHEKFKNTVFVAASKSYEKKNSGNTHHPCHDFMRELRSI